MKWTITKPLWVEILSALFVFLFAYTGLNKLLTRESFAVVLSQSPLIGNYSVLISWAIPIAELISAVLLLIPTTKRWGLYSFFVMMLAFTLYIAYMLATSIDLPCHCGGVISQLNWPQHLVFNIVVTALGWYAIHIHKTPAVNNSSTIRASV
jgi:uncharacterized membrane protein